MSSIIVRRLRGASGTVKARVAPSHGQGRATCAGMRDMNSGGSWRDRILTDDAAVVALLRRTHRVAVLGIKTADSGQPAHYVPQYAQRAGWHVDPVPVHYPDVVEILGERVYRTVAAVPGPVDMVNVFRRGPAIAAHVEDILAAKPNSVWFQLGIRNDDAAQRFARAGITVVQDRCLMVEMRHAGL